MKKRYRLLRHIIGLMFLIFAFFDAEILSAQSVISGRVFDYNTGETLPAANVQIDGTYRGTITNADGEFSILVESFPAIVVVRYIGYASRRIEVTENSPDRVEIPLEPTVYELEEVVVSEEDPAVSIMRKVIERKQIWREQLDGYEAEAYTRFTLANDTGIVSILESVTDVFWKQDEGMREVVKAQRKTTNMELDEFLPAAQFMANLYDDNIDLAGYTYIGVTHPDALKHYRFTLSGYRYIDDQLIYDISVEPRNKFKTAFSGQVSVMDEEYALVEVQLEPGESFRFPPPIGEFDMVLEQQYSNFGQDFWLPVDFRSQMELEIGLGRLLYLPTIYVSQVSRMTDYVVNQQLPDSLFAEENTVIVDSVAVADSLALNTPGLAVPLEKAEVAAYETIDSTMTLQKAYEPKGALASMIDTDDEQEVGSGERGISDFVETKGQLRFNRVEGLYAELGLEKSLTRWLNLFSRVGYSTALSGEPQFSYEVGGGLAAGRAHRFGLDVSYARYTDTQTPGSPPLRFVNGAFMLFGGTDYFDYYRSERLRTTLSYRNRVLDTRLSFGIRFEDHGSLEKQTDYDLFGGSRIQRLNPGIEEGRLRSLVGRIQIGDEGGAAGFTGQKQLMLELEYSDPAVIDSDFSFSTLQATLDWRFNTFFQRRLLPNTLDLRIQGQVSSGDVPLQRLGAIDGSMEIVSLFGSMKTREEIPYRGDRNLALFWEHNFKTFPFELIGADRLAENALNLIVFGGHGRSWLSGRLGRQNLPGVMDTNGWHHEVGISLSGVFSVIRIDMAQRLDEKGFYVGIGTARIF